MSEGNWDMLLRLFLSLTFGYFVSDNIWEWRGSRKKSTLSWMMLNVTVWLYNTISVGVYFAMREAAEL